MLLERERRRTSSPNASSVGPSVVGSWFSSCTCMYSSQQYDHVTPEVPKLQLLWVQKGRSGATFMRLVAARQALRQPRAVFCCLSPNISLAVSSPVSVVLTPLGKIRPGFVCRRMNGVSISGTGSPLLQSLPLTLTAPCKLAAILSARLQCQSRCDHTDVCKRNIGTIGISIADHRWLEFRGIEGMKEKMSSPRDDDVPWLRVRGCKRGPRYRDVT